jgi:glycosyltransferase involved in cell wall biosynthesis
MAQGNVSVSVVIPVMNERRTIARVIRQAFRVHSNTEVIVVANGSTDGTKQIAQKAGAKIISYDNPLGHDVGRAIGAKAARGEIVLFLDGDIVISAEQLKPLIKAVENGIDVALNKYSGPTQKQEVHNVVLAKHALNVALSRSQFVGASLTSIPHALSKKAIETIGAENLAVPPKAMAIAVHKGLEVRPVHFIDVGRTNPRKRKRMKINPMEMLIVGDHLEALHWITEHSNDRANCTDLSRNRGIVR